MRVVRGESRAADLPRGGVATIGNYDGIHRGQRAILDGVVARAREQAIPSAVVTFEPHPLAVLEPSRRPLRLTSDGQRGRLLAACGIDEIWIVPFTPELARFAAVDFVERVLVGGLGAREVHVGSSFRFGRNREGDLASLAAAGRRWGFEALGRSELLHGGLPISSSRIRQAVAAGQIELAAELLGRPFELTGTVVVGDRVGRELGWPTANLAIESELLPANGVYVSLTQLGGRDEPLPGVTNVGVRPTRDGAGERRVETFLFDFEGDLYGAQMAVAFVARLRNEERFPSLDALRAQIALDVAAGREYFARRVRSVVARDDREGAADG